MKRKQLNKLCKSFGDERRFFKSSLYGKVLRVNPVKLFKKCLLIDTLIPMTFFIPVIFAILVYMLTLGQEFMIDLTKKE